MSGHFYGGWKGGRSLWAELKDGAHWVGYEGCSGPAAGEVRKQREAVKISTERDKINALELGDAGPLETGDKALKIPKNLGELNHFTQNGVTVADNSDIGPRGAT